ncbi:MAG: GntR family transcriptional regulator, partial [Alphaproteobacteria bacterium]
MEPTSQIDIALDHNISVPLHAQLSNQILHLIFSGKWPPGSRIPSEAEFQQALSISRSTIRQALREAENQGLVVRVPGKGSFVADSLDNDANRRLIGYITSGFSYDLDQRLLIGAESAARAHGYRVIFCNANQSLEEENRLVDQLLQDRVSGLVAWHIIDPREASRLRQLIESRTLPVSLMDRVYEGAECDYVSSDNRRGGYLVTRHLLDFGHRRIAFVTRQLPGEVRALADRYAGYERALREMGLEPMEPVRVPEPEGARNMEEIVLGDPSEPEVAILSELLRGDDAPTALFALNDVLAAQIIKMTERVGLQVPEEVSVAGFDDVGLAAFLKTPLTTVSQDVFQIGYRAATLLVERIEGF